MTPKQFGRTIRTFRHRRKMTHRDLALVIDTGEQRGKAPAAAQAIGWHILPPDPPTP